MTAEEFVVQRYLEVEEKFNKTKEALTETKELLAQLQEKCADFERLAEVIDRHLKVYEFGIEFSIKNYIEADQSDLTTFAEFFNTKFKKSDSEEK